MHELRKTLRFVALACLLTAAAVGCGSTAKTAKSATSATSPHAAATTIAGNGSTSVASTVAGSGSAATTVAGSATTVAGSATTADPTATTGAAASGGSSASAFCQDLKKDQADPDFSGNADFTKPAVAAKVKAAFDKLANEAPASIKADIDLVRGVFDKVADAAAAKDTAAMTKLGTQFNTATYTAASKRLDAYVSGTCHISTGS